MFAIDYFGSPKRIINNVKDEREEMGTQSRIYDYNTGIYARILPGSNGEYGLAEAGRTSCGIFWDLYGFEELFDDDFDLSTIETDIDNLGRISTDEANFIIQNGFLEFLMRKGTPLTSTDEFTTILKAERILKSIETSGKITYDDVLPELQKRLEGQDLSDEDKKIIEQIKDVYENSMFSQIRKGREFNTLVEERKQKEGQHTAQEISDDLHEIARTGSKEDALGQIVDSRDAELAMSDYGFDENGLMFQEYGIEQIESMYEAFKEDFDENGLPLQNEEYDYAGTQLAEIMYNYTRYLKDKAQAEKKKDENTK